jgi:hypothetical protein
MTADPLFPTSDDLPNYVVDMWPCLRCGGLAWDRERHRAWHASVDTAETADLSRPVQYRAKLAFLQKPNPANLQRFSPGSAIHISRNKDGSLAEEILPPGSEIPP